jgi:predicted RNase H-like HicB family nuclease
MTQHRYPFTIEWSEEDQEYMATCSAFPGLTAFGITEEEALMEAKIALQGFIETFRANKMPLPESGIRSLYSGKLQLRLEKQLHRLAAQMARGQEVSLNTYIIDAIQAKVSGELVANRFINEFRVAIASGCTVLPIKTEITRSISTLSIEPTTGNDAKKSKDN